MSTSTPVTRPSRRQRKPRSDLKLGLAFILPATIGLVAFYIWPLIRGIWLSFTEYNLLTPAEFTGLDNYQRMVQDDTFWNAVVVTVEYVVINIGLQTILALVLIMTMIGSFQVFDTVSVATQGGPVNATRVLQYYIYDMAFGRFQFGYASAMAVGLLLVLAAITILQYRMTRAGETDLD